jgi:hypothetical protein
MYYVLDYIWTCYARIDGLHLPTSLLIRNLDIILILSVNTFYYQVDKICFDGSINVVINNTVIYHVGLSCNERLVWTIIKI